MDDLGSGENSQRSLDVELFTGRDYFATLTREIGMVLQANRLAFLTMGFEPSDPGVSAVLCELERAAARGIRVVFGLDAFGILDPRSVGPVILPPPYGVEASRQRRAAFERLSRYPSVRQRVINEPIKSLRSNFFAGRCHIKLSVVGARVYLGGPSFEATDRVDMTVAFTDEPIAHALGQMVEDILDAGDTRRALPEALRFDLDGGQSAVLVDGGVAGQSAIQDSVLSVIESAEAWITVGSQFLPSGKLGAALAAAMRRGVEVHIAYNRPANHDRLNRVHRIIESLERLRRPPAYFANRARTGELPFHMTAIATEQVGIVMSLNFVDVGVRWGTAEIAFVKCDTEFASEVHAAIIGAANPEGMDQR